MKLKKFAKCIMVFTVMLTTIFNSEYAPVKALSSLSGDDILIRAKGYDAWNYYDVGTCTGLVTRTLDDLGIGDSIVGSMVGTSARYSPDQMLANARANPNDAKLVYEGPASGAYNAGVKNGDLVLSTASEMGSSFGHVAFIEIRSGQAGWYGANNAIQNVGWQGFGNKARGSDLPGSVNKDIHVFRLVDDIQYGTLKIAKQDEDGAYIPNTSFKISYNSDMSSSIGTYTTGSNGTVSIEGLLTQKVYVQETSVPEPFILDSSIKEVTVIPNDTVTYSARNQFKTGNLEIQKYDVDTGKPVQVAGAEFSIYKKDGTFVNTISTNSNGVASLTGLRWGDYYYIESKSPTSYTSSTERVPFEIRDNGVTIKKSLSNKRTLGTIQLKKVDKETGMAAQGDATLEGAIYTLKAKEDILSPDDHHVIYKAGSVVSTMVIKDGATKVENLYLGKYEITEKTPSTGYLLDSNAYEITLNYTSQDKNG